MKKSLLNLLTLFPFAAHSGVTSDFFCFELSQSSPVKFEFRTFYDEASKWSGGFVKYAKSNVPISVVNGFPARRNRSSDALAEHHDVVRSRG